MCECLSDAERPPRTISPQWINQSGQVAHPDSPQGQGGLGAFRAAGVTGSGGPSNFMPDAESPVGQAGHPDAIRLGEGEKEKEVKRQPAPRVKTDAADEVVHGILTLQLKADVEGVPKLKGALTTFFNTSNGGQVSSHANEAGIVDKVDNTIAWTIEILTQYGDGDPEGDAAYGRGRTAADELAGNVTLGFHESCHRADLLNYFRNTAPPVFAGKVGDTNAAFKKAVDAYTQAWTTYFATAKKQSITNTDETGEHPMSQHKGAKHTG